MMKRAIESWNMDPYLLLVITKVILRKFQWKEIGENGFRDTNSTFCSVQIEALADSETSCALTLMIRTLQLDEIHT